MNFRLKSLIVWPKNTENEIRIISFELDKVSVITGGSEKGKSAIIAIVDYCLGSSSCRIPTKIIRDKSAFFGVLIELENNSQLLLARKEPGDEQVSNEMYLKEGSNIIVPDFMLSNCHTNDVKNRLNNIAKLSDQSTNTGGEKSAFDSRPAFRDLTSFLFQPQYIIANQSTLFYRADSFTHREKLRNIFPYIFKAVNNEYLELQAELRDIDKQISNIEKELEKRKKYSNKWLGELKGYFMQAKEFGLLRKHNYPDESWKNEEYLDVLRDIQQEVKNNIIPLTEIDNIVTTSNRLSDLTNKELELAYSINELKHRQELIRKLLDSNRDYRENLLNQDKRLKSASWIEKLIKKHEDNCPFCGSDTDNAKKIINGLLRTKNSITDKGLKLNDNYSVLSGEFKKISGDLSETVNQLNNVRKEIELLRTESNEESSTLQTLNAIYQFAGKVNAEIQNYDYINNDNDLFGELDSLESRKATINKSINADTIRTKTERAKRKIAESIKFYADIFKAENRNEAIEFNEKELTVSFIPKTGRKESLYEIGSGHNYLAYHLATLIALHEFFLDNSFHPVPNFIILDQPTQVYFPESSEDEGTNNIIADDIERVKRIFQVLQAANERTKGRLQIIVLEHVGSEAWKEFPAIEKIKRWRSDEIDNALIPSNWI